MPSSYRLHSKLIQITIIISFSIIIFLYKSISNMFNLRHMLHGSAFPQSCLSVSPVVEDCRKCAKDWNISFSFCYALIEGLVLASSWETPSMHRATVLIFLLFRVFDCLCNLKRTCFNIIIIILTTGSYKYFKFTAKSPTTIRPLFITIIEFNDCSWSKNFVQKQ